MLIDRHVIAIHEPLGERRREDNGREIGVILVRAHVNRRSIGARVPVIIQIDRGRCGRVAGVNVQAAAGEVVIAAADEAWIVVVVRRVVDVAGVVENIVVAAGDCAAVVGDAVRGSAFVVRHDVVANVGDRAGDDLNAGAVGVGGVGDDGVVPDVAGSAQVERAPFAGGGEGVVGVKEVALNGGVGGGVEETHAAAVAGAVLADDVGF